MTLVLTTLSFAAPFGCCSSACLVHCAVACWMLSSSIFMSEECGGSIGSVVSDFFSSAAATSILKAVQVTLARIFAYSNLLYILVIILGMCYLLLDNCTRLAHRCRRSKRSEPRYGIPRLLLLALCSFLPCSACSLHPYRPTPKLRLLPRSHHKERKRKRSSAIQSKGDLQACVNAAVLRRP